MTGSIRNSTYALNGLLRTNVTSVQNRVYPPGDRPLQAKYPRIQLTQYTPAERISGLGATVQSFADLRFDVEVWSKEPADCDTVADSVIQTIKENRNYVPATTLVIDKATVNTNGYFLMLRVTGGSDTRLVEPEQLYRRTVSIGGRWFQSA